ncbi:Heat shock 70 kDa 12B [Fusarium albosuccineum]|uniref:Heat shock 70 kDa 12B n=1 Tax=Fusarium albosuccineum TaxID=1237068 RepID=A0A8H4PFZ7_9HYPO|nr:Heat shock 70 kDa 12B [Fusarium albosuccineum]
MASTAESSAPTLVVGIDFGTTYSGVAWSSSARKNKPKPVTNWKTLKNFNSDKEKVPSAIHYDENSEEGPAWGYAVPLDENVLRWFKLLIIDEKDLPSKIRGSPQINTARARLLQLNKTPTEAIGDYLRAVWKHSRESIVRSVGQRMFKISRLHIIVTLPAIWPLYARIRMEEAMEVAGFCVPRPAGETTIDYISEPEAAALACLHETSEGAELKACLTLLLRVLISQLTSLRLAIISSSVTPVDIITYTVLKTHPLTVRESVKGDGDLCGAMFLDESFRVILKKLIPKDILEKMEHNDINKIMNDEWEHGIKPSVSKDSKPWDIPLPFAGTTNGRFHPAKISIKASVIRDMVYSPQVAKIKVLVAEQIRQFVILVGGFGRSTYLHECLEANLGGKIDILQDEGSGPWTAVVRGAVLHGQMRRGMSDSVAIAVESRICRYSYGTLVDIIPFEDELHAPQDRHFCPVNNVFLAANQTRWFVHVGEAVSTYKPISYQFWQDLSSPDDDIFVDIVISAAATPPMRKDKTVKPLHTIRISRIPNWDKLPSWTNKKGEEFRRVDYELRMISDGPTLEFSVRHNNRRLGAQNVSFETIDSSETQGSSALAPKSRTKQMSSRPDPDYVEGSDSDEEDDLFVE